MFGSDSVQYIGGKYQQYRNVPLAIHTIDKTWGVQQRLGHIGDYRETESVATAQGEGQHPVNLIIPI